MRLLMASRPFSDPGFLRSVMLLAEIEMTMRIPIDPHAIARWVRTGLPLLMDVGRQRGRGTPKDHAGLRTESAAA